MIEIDITHMVEPEDANQIDVSLLSGSQADLGSNAAEITWFNSRQLAAQKPLLSADQIEGAKKYFKGFGAWDDEEIAAWTDLEVQALVVQYIAGDIREMQGYDTFEEYEKDAIEGRVSSNIFKSGDKFYFSLSE